MSLLARNTAKVLVNVANIGNLSSIPPKRINKNAIKDNDPERTCDPRPKPVPPPKITWEKAIGKWIRKYITGRPEPKEPPPPDPRPVCSPCMMSENPLPPFPKLSCLYEGVYEHTGNQPPLEGETVFLLKQSVSAMTGSDKEKARAREKAMLKYIETEEHIRDFQDPISEFSSVAERLLELTDKRLHPLYNQYLKLAPLDCQLGSRYFIKRMTKPPIRIRYNMKQLEKKNFFVDLKRSDPPPIAICTQALDLKVQEKNMLDMKKRATVKKTLEMARMMVQEDDEYVPIVKRIGDNWATQKVC